MKKYNIGISAVMLALSIAILISSSQLKSVEGAMGPGTWPSILAIILIFLSILLILQSLSNRATAPIDFKSAGMKRVLLSSGDLLAFCVLIYFFGFMVAAAFLIPTIMFIMNEKRKKVLLFTTAGVLAAVYVIFSVILNLPLPKGIWL